jgi:hypothetical protein
MIPIESLAARLHILPSEDAYVDRDNPSTNYGSSTRLVVEYFDFLEIIRKKYVYLRFDLEEIIPPDATINTAYLSIYQNDPCQGAHFGIFNITESWLEGDVTWDNRPSYGSRISYVDGAGPCGWFQVPVTSLVQEWHSGATPNYGMGILFSCGTCLGGSSPREFSSREHQFFEPRLVIIFNAESIVLDPGMDSMVSQADPGSNFGAGNGLQVYGVNGFSIWSYLQFDVDPIPDGAVINYARLRLYQTNGVAPVWGGQRAGLYEVSGAWDDATITWNNKPAHGGTAWSIKGTYGNAAFNGWMDWNVTYLLSSYWLTDPPSPNYGLVIKHPEDTLSSDNLGGFRSSEHSTESQRPQLEVFYEPAPANYFVLWQEFPGLARSDGMWGDFDNDGDLDLVVCGETGSDTVTVTYENDGNGNLSEHANDLPGVTNQTNNCLAWGDYDNDGDLDLAVASLADSGNVTCIYNNDGDGNLTWDAEQNRQPDGLVQVRNAALAWGDYDSDGDLDLVVQGDDTLSIRIDLYVNDPPGTLTRTVNSLTALRTGTLDWVDYDGDGDMDLVQTGYDGVSARYIVFYKNHPRGSLSYDGDHGLLGVNISDIAWGDFDNDGDMDLAYSGSKGSAYFASVYRNDGAGNLTQVDYLKHVYRSAVAWGDFDNDGMLDLALCGRDTSGAAHSRLYRYNGGDGFDEYTASLTGMHSGVAAWADLDEDGDLDLLLTGRDNATPSYNRYCRIYRNDGGTPNNAPTPPNSFSAFQSFPMAPPFPGTLHLQWGGASDTETPDNALYYCVRVGTDMNEDDVFSGTFGSPLMGNAGQTTELDITIPYPERPYYWSVQAIDAGLAVSEWSHGWCSWDADSVRSRKIDSPEDAYVDSQNPNNAHGVTDSTRLIVGDQSGAWGTVARSYLKFYLGGELPPDTNAIIKAELYLYCIDSQPPGPYWVGVWEEGVDTWAENTITWHTAPIMFDPSAASIVQINGAGWYAWDITSIFTSSGDNLTMVLRGKNPPEGTTGVVAEFWSSEYAVSSRRPYILVSFSAVSGAEDDGGAPAHPFSLSQNVPNPFNPHTRISYSIPEEAANKRVLLKIFDVAGRQVRILVNAPQAAGGYVVAWDGTNDKGNKVASGVYFYRLQWNGRKQTKKMVLLR